MDEAHPSQDGAAKTSQSSSSADGPSPESSAAVRQLVAGIAHEINNPINFISANLGFLEDHVNALLVVIDALDDLKLDDEDRMRLSAAKEAAELDYVRGDLPAVLAAIREGNERVAGVVNDLRSLAQRSQEPHRVVDLSALVRRSVLLCQKSPTAAEVRAEVAEGMRVEGSEAQLGQVLLNLVKNAIEASADAKGAAAEVVVVGRSDADRALVEVSDNGPGVAPELTERIFDPFFTTKPVGQGTGLGLAVSRGIARHHEGELGYRRDEGWSRFTLVLPHAAGQE